MGGEGETRVCVIMDSLSITTVLCTHEAGARVCVLDSLIITMVLCTHEAGACMCIRFIDYYYGTVYSRGWRARV